MRETWVWSLGWEDSPGGGHGNPLQYSCLENPHGQRSLADYSPWHCKEWVMTERPSTARKAENNLPKQWFSVSVCLEICWWTYEYRSLGPTFRVPDSVILGQDLRICISSKVGPCWSCWLRTCIENHCHEACILLSQSHWWGLWDTEKQNHLSLNILNILS